MIRSAWLLFFVLVATIAAENLDHDDLVGTWHSDLTAFSPPS